MKVKEQSFGSHEELLFFHNLVTTTESVETTLQSVSATGEMHETLISDARDNILRIRRDALELAKLFK